MPTINALPGGISPPPPLWCHSRGRGSRRRGSLCNVDPVVYIPNLNGRERLLQAIASLGPLDGFRIAVVDNGSSDGSASAVRHQHPEVELLELPTNLGFGRALNRVVAEIPGDPLIFINNDVVCEPRFVAALIAALDEDAASVAGVLVQEDSPGTIDSAGVLVEPDTLMAFDYLHGDPVAKLPAAPSPLGPTGGAALFRRGAFESAGGFDERIFIYFEDADLALRMRSMGMTCRLAPDARARHGYSITLGGRSTAKYRLSGWSRGYMLRRYGIMRRPRSALRAVAGELAVVGGQVRRDRTLAGFEGRIRGFHAGRGLPRLLPPSEGLVELSLSERLRLRAQRRR